MAIADWAMLYEDSSETLRGTAKRCSAGRPAEKPEQYAASSPIADVERVRAPLLIIQGSEHDTRTPARPVEVYAERLRALGKTVEVEWFETGHVGGFADIDLGIAHQERMLRFAQACAGVAAHRNRVSSSAFYAVPVSACGAATGFDSGEPRWRRKIDSTTIEKTARNSLCQFWNDSNQNSLEVRRNSTSRPPGHRAPAAPALYSRGAADGVQHEREQEQEQNAIASEFS